MKKQILSMVLFLYTSIIYGQALSSLRYDLDLELDHLVVSNVRDADSTEDLYGHLIFMELKAFSARGSTQFPDFWSQTEHYADSGYFRNGTYQVDCRRNLIKNLSFNQLKNVELKVGGYLYDDEGIFESRLFICHDCVYSGSSIQGSRTLKFIEMSTTQSSINSLVNNGNFQALRFGSDRYFELNYYERNVKNDGWVKAMWKVWVKPHS